MINLKIAVKILAISTSTLAVTSTFMANSMSVQSQQRCSTALMTVSFDGYWITKEGGNVRSLRHTKLHWPSDGALASTPGHEIKGIVSFPL